MQHIWIPTLRSDGILLKVLQFCANGGDMALLNPRCEANGAWNDARKRNYFLLLSPKMKCVVFLPPHVSCDCVYALAVVASRLLLSLPILTACQTEKCT